MRFGFGMLAVAVIGLAACGGSTNGDLVGGDGGGSGGAGGGSAGSATGGTGGTGGSGTGGTGGSGTGGTGGSGTGGTGGSGTGGVGGSGTGGVGGSATGGAGGGVGGVGGAGGSAGTGGNATACSTVCQKLDQAQCPNDEPYTACVAGCQVDFGNYQQQCSSQVSTWMSCVTTQGKATCDANGESRIVGCDSQLVSFVQCSACIPSTGDDACDACTKSSCCSQLKALYSHPQFAPYLSCVYACATQQCEYNCYVQYSGLSTVISQLNQCQGMHCAAC